MSDNANVKIIKDTDLIQEGEVTLEGYNIEEVKSALAVVTKMRRQALEELEVDEEPEDEDEIVVTSVEFRIEGDKVIAHVTQGLVE